MGKDRVCTKSKFVMEVRLGDYNVGQSDNVVGFTARDPDNRDYTRDLWMERKQWEEMGKPSVVTVTVRVGDTLNGDS